MVDGLFFCATLTGRRGGDVPFVQTGAETPATGAEAVKAGPRIFLGGSLPHYNNHYEVFRTSGLSQWCTIFTLQYCRLHYVYFYELRLPVSSRYFFALLLFCFYALSLGCFHTSAWPSFYLISSCSR